MQLFQHAGATAVSPMAIAVQVRRSDCRLAFAFSLSASADTIRIPPPAEPGRADGLWQTSCFEAFIRGEGERYAELNFSPSGQWAAYLFDSYRTGMRELEMPQAPEMALSRQPDQLRLSASLRLPPEFMQPGAPAALSAVIEAVDGTKSYWSLAHADGPPDFHHPDCFAAPLP